MIVTTTYNLKIEGELIGRFICPHFGYKMVAIKLTKPFGFNDAGAIQYEHYNSVVIKSSLKFSMYGNGQGIAPDWYSIPDYKI